MKSSVLRVTLKALLAVSMLGVTVSLQADEATDDLQAGIDAFNRGDLPGAMTLYEKAAEAGSAEAQVRLAYLLDYAQDDERAVHWYRAAADQGSLDGIAGLAAMYVKGEGVEEDYARARELYEKAAEAGHEKSIRVLIGIYENGELDVEKDATRAAYWKEKQATLSGSGN